jgi:two-component system chemotaxis sensor kinase CheA
VEISVEDDGRGVDAGRVAAAAGRALDHAGALRAVFESGVSTAGAVTDVSGRGVGLDAVRDAVAEVRGRVALDSRPGAGTRVTLAVPLTVAVVPCLILEAAGRRWALPLQAAVSAHRAGERPTVEGEPVAAAPLADVLGLAPADADAVTAGPAVVLAVGDRQAAVRVDAITGEREVLLKDVGAIAGRLELVAGAAVEPDGAVLVVLDPAGVVAGARALAAGRPGPVTRVPARRAAPARRAVLVVDDALTIRELQRAVLERAGYEARVAEDGAEALRLLRDRRPDAVVTDVEMPIMDGVALTAAIRATPGMERLPVIVLSSREAEADRRRALEAGADEYLGKSEFDEQALLETIARRLGQAG